MAERVSVRKLKENDFENYDYDEFYQDHFFDPFPDEAAINAHEHLPRVGWALDIAREIDAKTVLDLGCLEGYCVLTLSKHTGCTGVGVDLSKDGIELGKARAKKYKLPVSFIQGSLEDTLVKAIKLNLKYDLICAFEVMEHVENPDLVFDLASKCLTDKGEILVSTPAFESPTYGKNDVSNKCHVRLFTTRDEDYQEMTNHDVPNEPQKLRQATSLSKMVGKSRIKEMDVWSELIHARIK
jgi:2-polyprenyl-3-methyl-5-hydroxy-6-metoxy-1,4-benzoquinol methylase